tara:strand:- start:513 stop:1274 length:762 start_codon:yes stop_codon:yes gene_type:complete
MDLISVIMPFYKKREYFSQSFESVINQTYDNIEILVIYDDTDQNDLEFIQKFIHNERRASLIINNENLGAAKSRNIAIKKSKGKYLAFIDCDDVWLLNKLELQYKYMKDNKFRITHTNYKIIDYKNKILGENLSKEKLTYRELINSCDIGLSSVMALKEVFNLSEFKHIKTKEDYALWLELTRKGENFFCMKESLTLWRKSKNSLSSSFKDKIINGFIVYNKFEKKNLLLSIFLVINLGLHYIKKSVNQKKNL